MNETLSPSQAKSIVDTVNEIMCACKQKTENKLQEFIEQVSHIWEDNNAVDFFAQFKANMENFIKELSSNNEVFDRAIEEIANYYAKVGNMAAIAVNYITLSPFIDVSKIKEFFTDSENEDDFGFKNVSAGAAQVMDAFKDLESALTNIAAETVSKINSINAFGNASVKMEVAKSAGKIVDILKGHIAQAKALISDHVEQTAQAYIRTGANATQSATLTTN